MKNRHWEYLAMMNEYLRREGCAWIASGSILLFAAVTGHARDWQAAVVRDAEGPCAVIDGTAGSLTIAVRAPSSPSAEAVATLPEHLRDFSSLPTRIVLQSPPGSGTGAPVDRLPTTMEAGVHYPVIEGALSTVPFVRATFPRAWVVEGTAIVAEKSVRAPDGTRVSTQSVCRITAADAAQWR